MNPLQYLVRWLISYAQRTPYFHLEGYMLRWWLVPYEEKGSETAIGCGVLSWWRRPIGRLLQKLGLAVRVHEILRSDRDRDFHDHPWPYLTVILRGGYYELTPHPDGGEQWTWHGPGSILFRPARSWHRLVVPNGKTATTLFITGRYEQKWGFLKDGAKVPYDEYLRGRS